MSKPLLERVQQEGYCCLFAYMISNTDLTTKEMSKELDANPRTIRIYKAKVRDGECTCRHSPFCCFSVQSPQELSLDHPEPPQKVAEMLRLFSVVKPSPSEE